MGGSGAADVVISEITRYLLADSGAQGRSTSAWDYRHFPRQPPAGERASLERAAPIIYADVLGALTNPTGQNGAHPDGCFPMPLLQGCSSGREDAAGRSWDNRGKGEARRAAYSKLVATHPPLSGYAYVFGHVAHITGREREGNEEKVDIY
ncbi:hypothetical protein KM043_010604 [Ampulex compressa]|nr:hypothetical protein KM043_010604 [Ampulex compressa]